MHLIILYLLHAHNNYTMVHSLSKIYPFDTKNPDTGRSIINAEQKISVEKGENLAGNGLGWLGFDILILKGCGCELHNFFPVS